MMAGWTEAAGSAAGSDDAAAEATGFGADVGGGVGRQAVQRMTRTKSENLGCMTVSVQKYLF